MSELTTALREPDEGADERTDEGDDIAKLEAEVAAKRERVAHSLGELRHQWNGATSWGHWIAARPVVWLGVGLCVGLLVGYGTRPRRE